MLDMCDMHLQQLIKRGSTTWHIYQGRPPCLAIDFRFCQIWRKAFRAVLRERKFPPHYFHAKPPQSTWEHDLHNWVFMCSQFTGNWRMLSWFQLGDTCMQFSGRMWVPCGSVIGQLTKKGRLGTAWVHSGWCAVCTVHTLSTHQSALLWSAQPAHWRKRFQAADKVSTAFLRFSCACMQSCGLGVWETLATVQNNAHCVGLHWFAVFFHRVHRGVCPPEVEARKVLVCMAPLPTGNTPWCSSSWYQRWSRCWL